MEYQLFLQIHTLLVVVFGALFFASLIPLAKILGRLAFSDDFRSEAKQADWFFAVALPATAALIIFVASGIIIRTTSDDRTADKYRQQQAIDKIHSDTPIKDAETLAEEREEERQQQIDTHQSDIQTQVDEQRTRNDEYLDRILQETP